MRLIYFAGLVFLIYGCTDRDRLNPLDPNNPDTLGRPSGFRVISMQDTVFLRWNSITLHDLVGYRIYRKVGDAPEFSQYALVSKDLNSFKDSNVQFNTRYEYQLTAFGANYESAPSESQHIIPGPTFNWAADNRTGQLVKLTHDAQHQIFRTDGFFTIVDIDPNPLSGDVWVLERQSSFIGNVLRVSASGEILSPIVPFVAPVDADIHLDSNVLWVADLEDGRVVKLDSIGNRIATVRELLAPVAVAVDQRSGACWAADQRLQKVARINEAGTVVDFSMVGFVAVQSLAVNSQDGSVWAADSTRVLKLTEDGNLELIVSHVFEYAKKVEVNEITGEAWVIDFGPSSLLKFSASGQKMLELSGFSEPRDLAVNLSDNSCLVGDSENNRLVRVGAGGDVEGEFAIGFPDAVSVQFMRSTR